MKNEDKYIYIIYNNGTQTDDKVDDVQMFEDNWLKVAKDGSITYVNLDHVLQFSYYKKD